MATTAASPAPTPSTLSTLATVPTPTDNTDMPSYLAITTTFTPPATCTQHRLTMLANRSYQIWLNEPLPVPNITMTDCYPPQYISSYITDAIISSASSSPSSLPPFSTLVCPDYYTTVLTINKTYIACCPSSFLLHTPDPPLSTRPAYGGTCYSDIDTVTVTFYDNSTVAATSVWAASTTGAQAYAHVVDGYALPPTTFANATRLPTLTPTPTSASGVEGGLSTGAKAGVGVGVAIGVLALLGVLLFLLRRCRRGKGGGGDGVVEAGPGKKAVERKEVLGDRPPVYEMPAGEGEVEGGVVELGGRERKGVVVGEEGKEGFNVEDVGKPGAGEDVAKEEGRKPAGNEGEGVVAEAAREPGGA